MGEAPAVDWVSETSTRGSNLMKSQPCRTSASCKWLRLLGIAQLLCACRPCRVRDGSTRGGAATTANYAWRTQVQTTPTVVEALRSRNLSAVRSMTRHSHHSAMIAMDGELYTWGLEPPRHVSGHAHPRPIRGTYGGPGPRFWASGPSWKERGSRHGPRLRAKREFTSSRRTRTKGPPLRVARKLMEEEAIRLDMLALEDEQDAATLRGSQAGTQDDGTLATGEDDHDHGRRSIMSGGGGRGGPAGILDPACTAALCTLGGNHISVYRRCAWP